MLGFSNKCSTLTARTWTATGRTGCQPRKPKALVCRVSHLRRPFSLQMRGWDAGWTRGDGKEKQHSPVSSISFVRKAVLASGDLASWQHCQPPPRITHALGCSKPSPHLKVFQPHVKPYRKEGLGKEVAAAQLCSYQQALGQNVLHQLEVVAKLFVLAAGPLHLLVCVEAEVLRLILELALLQHCKPTDTQARGQVHMGRCQPRANWQPRAGTSPWTNLVWPAPCFIQWNHVPTLTY